jgi:hypothetical protein
MGPCASSFASSWTRVTRYPDYKTGLASVLFGAGRSSVPGRRTKLVSAACVSCCSAAPRTAASVGSQYRLEWGASARFCLLMAWRM